MHAGFARPFLQKRIQIPHKHTEKCSTSFVSLGGDADPRRPQTARPPTLPAHRPARHSHGWGCGEKGADAARRRTLGKTGQQPPRGGSVRLHVTQQAAPRMHSTDGKTPTHKPAPARAERGPLQSTADACAERRYGCTPNYGPRKRGRRGARKHHAAVRDLLHRRSV